MLSTVLFFVSIALLSVVYCVIYAEHCSFCLLCYCSAECCYADNRTFYNDAECHYTETRIIDTKSGRNS